ncbi:Putative ribonuclease H protein At1g65750 [Linum perenne]
MHVAVLPVTTCEEIDQKIHNFVWGSSDETRKVHLVAWETICTPKEDGGLGLKLARQLNRAYLTKLAVNFIKDPDKLWVRIIHAKYFKETNEGFTARKSTIQSPLCRGITREWGTILKGARVAIQNGRDTTFWTSCWVDSDERLCDLINDVAPPYPDACVADFITSVGSWDLTKLNHLLPSRVVSTIISMTDVRVFICV